MKIERMNRTKILKFQKRLNYTKSRCLVADVMEKWNLLEKVFVHILHVIYMNATNVDIKKNF